MGAKAVAVRLYDSRNLTSHIRFIVGMVPPANLDDLSHTELKNLVVALFEQVAELRRTIAAQANEIARLKGGPRRPNIKPSGMEKATEPKSDKPADEGGGKRGDTKSKLTIHEEKTVKADAPAGSRFKGYTSFVVQDQVVRPHVTNFRCERWQTPDGKVMTASLPAGIDFRSATASLRARPLPVRYYGGRRRDELDIVAWINGQLMEFRYAETPRR
jgi:hypothetical protein